MWRRYTNWKMEKQKFWNSAQREFCRLQYSSSEFKDPQKYFDLLYLPQSSGHRAKWTGLHDARRLCYDRHLRLQYIRYQRDSGGLSCYEVFNNRLYSWTGFEIRRYFYAASVSDRMIYHENEAYSYLIIGIICFVLGCLITLKK